MPTDRGEIALVEVAERRARRAAEIMENRLGRVEPHLIGRRRDRWHRRAGVGEHGGDVAHGEHMRVVGEREIGGDDDAPGAVERDAELFGEGGGLIPGAPEHGVRIDPFARCHGHAGVIDADDGGVGEHLDPEVEQIAFGPRAESLRELRQQPRARFQQHDARGRRIDAAEIALHRLVGDLGDHAGQFHASGASADDHERQ